MTDRESMITKILAEPNDDVNRLVYADWLDENGEGERDRVTAEFIRLSCRMEKSNRLSSAEAKWLDKGMNYAALLPTLFAWIYAFNENHREAREWFGAERAPSVTWERKGRYLAIKHRTSPLYIPEICAIEFWRGFVRKVVNRHHEMSDKFIRLILPDQPLCEPTLRWMESRAAAGNHRHYQSAWSGAIGLKAHGLVEYLPTKTKPDRTTSRGEHWVHIWEYDVSYPTRWTAEKRRYFAVAWLLRRTAMMEVPSAPVTQTEGAT